jgi:hypothetical protein
VDVGPYAGAPQVTVANGSVVSGLVNVANLPNSEGFLRLDNVSWDVHGELNVGGTPGAAGGTGAITIDNNSAVNVDLALRVWPRGTVQYNSGSLTVHLLDVRGRLLFGATGPARTLRTTFIDIAPGGLVDMTHNFMIIDYTGASAIPPVVVNLVSGYANGAWTGPGINSSTAATGVTHGIGFAEAGALGLTTFGGQMVDNTTVVLRSTRYGDANVDGVVNLNDFNILAANFGQLGRYWWEGDFTFDGVVNLNDFNRLAANFGLSAAGTGVTPQDWAALASAVPEPAAATGVSLVATGAILRRRRRS